MNDLTTSYFSIEKSDKQPDGTLMVYGKATDDSVDIDQQICDAGWLDRAMPAWFKSGGNIREQHSSIAAGVAKEYEPKADGHYIMAHIVDPVSVKKVDAGVLRGFSIGIKSPRVVRDTKAANGRIIDGQIVEVSLVDRPANPNCQLVLAKSVDGESSLVQVEELNELEKHGSHNQQSHGRRGSGGGGMGGGSGFDAAGRGGNSDSTGRSINPKRNDQLVSKTINDTEDVHNEINNLSDEDDPSFIDDFSDDDEMIIDDSLDNLKEAQQHLQNAYDAPNSAKHLDSMENAQTRLDDAYDSLKNADNKTLRNIADKVDDIGAEVDSYIDVLMGGEGDKGANADLRKHGSHNQSSHGRRGAGGGAGGGGGASTPSKNPTEDKPVGREAKFKLSEHKNTVDSIHSDAKAIAEKDSAVAGGVKELKYASNMLNEAKNSDTVHEAVQNMRNARSNLQNASDVFENQNYHGIADRIRDTMVEINSNAVAIGRGMIKSTEADLEKHGSHNQSSHGRRGSGGGAGGGGGSTYASAGLETAMGRARKEGAQDTIASAEKDLNDAYVKLYKEEGGTSPRMLDAEQFREDAFHRIDDAKTYIDSNKRVPAATSLREAARILKKEPTFKPAASKLTNAAAILLGEKTKATDADLRKALQSALQLHSLNKSEEATMENTVVELPVEVVADLLKFDATQYEAARNALASLIEVEASEMREGHNEIQSIGHLLQSVMHLHAWYEGEEAEGEVMEQEEIIERAADAETKEKLCKECNKSEKMCKCEGGYKAADEDAEKSVEGEAPVEAPAEATETPAEETPVVEEALAVEEAPVETTEVSADEKPADVEALVEQVVKSATESLKSEIAELVSAKEAALSKAMKLETELELAKSLAVAGGPSRTAKPINVKTTNDLLTKAAIYKAKANATTDPTLAKGYKTLAEEFLNKASEADNK